MGSDAVRKTIPLTAEDLVQLEKVRAFGTTENLALAELVGEAVARSESATLHALLVLGLRALHNRAEEHGYAALAAGQDDEDRAYHQAVRGRRGAVPR